MILSPRRLTGFLAAVLLAAIAGACGADDGAGHDSGTTVVASFYPLAEAARQIGGERVVVTNLTPPGTEPHDLELTTRQVDDLEDADLAVVMGRDFQPAVEDVADRRDGPTVIVLDALDEGSDAQPSDDEEVDDPHVWLDPTKMSQIVDTVKDALVEVDPSGRSAYEANAATYEQALEMLDEQFTDGLAACKRDEIVTSHAAFGWLARRYGLEQHAIAGIDPEQEPSADRIAELADRAEREGATTIFTEDLASPRVAKTLAREAGGLKTAVLNPLEGLTDEQQADGDNYVTVMRANLAALRRALGCA